MEGPPVEVSSRNHLPGGLRALELEDDADWVLRAGTGANDEVAFLAHVHIIAAEIGFGEEAYYQVFDVLFGFVLLDGVTNVAEQRGAASLKFVELLARGFLSAVSEVKGLDRGE